jgi:hypothetical protein
MTVETLFYHLCELGVRVKTSADARALELDAPRGTLTPELVGLLREHRDELLEYVFECEERGAIEWEGKPTIPMCVKLEGSPLLVEMYRHDPRVVALAELLTKHGGGGVLQFMGAA